mgnify:CR=1 FL=1
MDVKVREVREAEKKSLMQEEKFDDREDGEGLGYTIEPN